MSIAFGSIISANLAQQLAANTVVKLNGLPYEVVAKIPGENGGVFRVLARGGQLFVQTNRGLISVPRNLAENAAVVWAKKEVDAGRIAGAVGATAPRPSTIIRPCDDGSSGTGRVRGPNMPCL